MFKVSKSFQEKTRPSVLFLLAALYHSVIFHCRLLQKQIEKFSFYFDWLIFYHAALLFADADASFTSFCRDILLCYDAIWTQPICVLLSLSLFNEWIKVSFDAISFISYRTRTTTCCNIRSLKRRVCIFKKYSESISIIFNESINKQSNYKTFLSFQKDIILTFPW